MGPVISGTMVMMKEGESCLMGEGDKGGNSGVNLGARQGERLWEMDRAHRIRRLGKMLYILFIDMGMSS